MTKVSLEQFAQAVSKDNVEFAEALREERKALELCNEVRQHLKELRRSAGLSQEQVAKSMDISQPAVSKIENGEGDIGLLTICRYLRALSLRLAVNYLPDNNASMNVDRTNVAPEMTTVLPAGMTRSSIWEGNHIFPIDSVTDFYSLMDQAVVIGLGNTAKGIQEPWSANERTWAIPLGREGWQREVHQGWVPAGRVVRPEEGSGVLGVQYDPELGGVIISRKSEDKSELSGEEILHSVASHLAETFMHLPGVHVYGGSSMPRRGEDK